MQYTFSRQWKARNFLDLQNSNRLFQKLAEQCSLKDWMSLKNSILFKNMKTATPTQSILLPKKTRELKPIIDSMITWIEKWNKESIQST